MSSVSASRIKPQMTPSQAQHLLDSGIESGDVVRLLVATGAWSESGAAEIVSTLIRVDTGRGAAAENLGWPGPIDEPPPLFAR